MSAIYKYRKLLVRKSVFNEDLQLTFSVADGEEANFNIKKIG